jgi:hypothetical protein
MLYDGKPVDLTTEQEEVASMFAVMKETNYALKPQFLKNFWEGFKEVSRAGSGEDCARIMRLYDLKQFRAGPEKGCSHLCVILRPNQARCQLSVRSKILLYFAATMLRITTSFGG